MKVGVLLRMAIRSFDRQFYLDDRTLDSLGRLRYKQRVLQKGSTSRTLACYSRYL